MLYAAYLCVQLVRFKKQRLRNEDAEALYIAVQKGCEKLKGLPMQAFIGH